MLFDGRRRDRVLQLLYISRHIMRPDRGGRQAAFLAPREKPVAGSDVSPARVRVADVGREEFDVAPGGFVAEIGDQCRHDVRRALVGGDAGLGDGRRKLVL